MFWVINKDKVYSYIITLSVIGVLFVMSVIIPKNEATQTSAKINENVNEVVNETARRI